jgi:hypothetical protein
MDAHLIGIELTQLLLKLNAPGEKQGPVKAAKAAAKPAISAPQTCRSTKR